MARPPLHRIAHIPCPVCKHSLNGAFENGTRQNRAPIEGDLIICGACTAVLKFDSDLQLVSVSREELESIANEDPEYAALISDSQKTLLRLKHMDN